MNPALAPRAFVAVAVVAVLGLLAALFAAPHERYYRFQAYDSGTTRKADWIYERLWFDPTPVDVALVGTSRTGGALSGPQIEAGYCALTGRRARVANLSIPETGRNLHYVIAKEAVRAKRPALVVVELNETEARKPHRGFVFLADARDALAAPVAINVNYFSDLARLPGRQARLLFETAARRPTLRARFDPAAYAGAHLDRTRELDLIDGRRIFRAGADSAEALDAQRRRRLAKASARHVLPAPLRVLEYRFSRRYLEAIEDLAASADARVDYVFVPAWRAPAMDDALLAELGVDGEPMRVATDLTDDAPFWFDDTHLSASGAARASRDFAAALADRHPRLGAPGDCPTFIASAVDRDAALD